VARIAQREYPLNDSRHVAPRLLIAAGGGTRRGGDATPYHLLRNGSSSFSRFSQICAHLRDLRAAF
jgi:hypothetical protein